MAGYIISINEKKNKGAIENCFSKGIYSTILSKPKGYWGIHHEGTFADYFGMKPGDNIYFFSDRKIYGIGKLIKLKKDCKYWNYQGADFINKTELSSLKNTILYDEGTNEDNRCICCFEPSPLFFKEGIDMDDVLASNPSKFKMLRAFWKLSFIKIDNIENQALIDIFLKRNEENLNTKKNVFEIDKTWHNRINQKVKDFHLMRADNILQDTAEGNKIKHEMAIEAGLVDILSMQENSIFGKWDYISHQVVASPFKPIDYMDKMDIYGYRYVNGYTTISKYLVMEIKKDEADLGVVDQIMKYVDWVNTEYAYGDYSMIEAFVVASNFSVEAYGFEMPSYEKVEERVHLAINQQWISKAVVNSENEIDTLLDEDGQLRLRTPLNIFIGGQILDRGITIANLIGFYYGRAPQKMQQDTVLQHARMYGYRRKEDLAVTRFYTTRELYHKMAQINEFDAKLREDFEQGNFEKGIIFISKDEQGKIIPCSPNKILLSNTYVLKPGKTTLPVGFQTGYKTYIKKHVDKIDRMLKGYRQGELGGRYRITKEDAITIIENIYQTLEIEQSDCISEKAFISLLNYLSTSHVNVYCGTDRNISRLRTTSRYYSDMPFNRDNDLRQAKDMAIEEPTLMLMRQNGLESNGWRGAEFYWPVLVTQHKVEPAVYSSELLKE